MHDDTPPPPIRTWLSTIPALLVLLLAVAQGTGEIVQARMLAVGEATWPGYAELRGELVAPECVVDDIGKAAPEQAAAGSDDAMLDDLFEDEPDGEAPAPAPEPEAAPPEAPADEAPAGEGEDEDLLDDLFDEGGGGAAAPSDAAIDNARKRCQERHDRYEELLGKLSPSVEAYRGVDGFLSTIIDFGRRTAKPSLIFLIVICAATASALRAHISLRPVRTLTDARVADLGQLTVNLLAMASSIARYVIVSNAGVDQHETWLALVWAAGFAAMALIDVVHLARPGKLPEGGSVAGALLTIPLYAAMGAAASTWFLLFESHPSGLAIYLDKITEHAGLYLQVGLFVWAGMLLKRTRLAHLFFDLVRPWKLAPELLVIVVVLAAAIPTAYSGASGIFVIAAGAIIYDELRASGARNELALAATAMSGSLGVVLSPCLLVVIVAALNKQVTTTELFDAGYYVFALTAVLFIIGVLATRQNPLTLAPAGEAMAGTLAAARRLVPYVVVFVVTLGFYGFVLHAWPDEHSAARIMLVVLLLFLIWEGFARGPDDPPAMARLAGSTTETTEHIGALLTLMALSIGFGGIVERAEVMSMVPAELGSPWLAMLMLTAMLVVIGMLMDPYGAVILVSATIAHVAYDNGIAPLHFWMVVLVAFELGYLTPPVALNHLLTRSVVGDQADISDVPADASFWARHERVMLPVAVMGTALLLVAFVPLALGWS